ncbi:translation initiation factor eif-2b subunit alpha [Plakobranchus ocellatus]|uniref:Translation initiation factor eif-2b subunit alpha n=1 Tax=Plakobranchus ocellatus TaxID=259542 RepID=A0AAV4DAV2_9GAST|nr:translation initiation factor eif-2b subunit alpha [Plakobranchus ocellatus]
MADFEQFTSKLLDAARSSIPFHKGTKNKTRVPWFTQECRQALRERKKAQRKHFKTPSLENFIGTYPLAVCAKQMNKPVYVVAESFKFVRFFPLSQRDVPDEYKYHASTISAGKDLEQEHPIVDFTGPEFISLMFTDLGVLTPSAVSDELIKLYC